MVTTYALPRVLARTTNAAARATAVTRRDIVALRNNGYWIVVVSGFFEPVLYLLSIGVGVGGLVGGFVLPDGSTISYAAFVAPAMLGASAMNGAMTEVTFNFFGKLKWVKLYDGMVATPLRPVEIALGELGWAMTRGALYSFAFLAIMVALGLTTVGWAIPALFASLLVGFAFGGAGMAISTVVRTWQDFDYVAVVQFALFLFSGTFVPASTYPPGLRQLIELTPLYQAVALLRDLTTGRADWGLGLHVLYLAAMAAIGLWIAARRMGNLLCR